ncbi:hypothetical protein M758_3G094900 [Ceratodon purpureus]|nr:hypothetical protein M758_3G094900 [Ceratodon purpureus]
MATSGRAWEQQDRDCCARQNHTPKGASRARDQIAEQTRSTAAARSAIDHHRAVHVCLQAVVRRSDANTYAAYILYIACLRREERSAQHDVRRRRQDCVEHVKRPDIYLT